MSNLTVSFQIILSKHLTMGIEPWFFYANVQILANLQLSKCGIDQFVRFKLLKWVFYHTILILVDTWNEKTYLNGALNVLDLL